MSRANTWLSSKVSPVLIRCAARSTLAGVMWLPEPRSSAAPHFEGQRSLGDGGCQLCAVASVAKTQRPTTVTMARLFIAFLPFVVTGIEFRRACRHIRLHGSGRSGAGSLSPHRERRIIRPAERHAGSNRLHRLEMDLALALVVTR